MKEQKTTKLYKKDHTETFEETSDIFYSFDKKATKYFVLKGLQQLLHATICFTSKAYTTALYKQHKFLFDLYK